MNTYFKNFKKFLTLFKKSLTLCFLGCFLGLAGCTGVDVTDYKGTTPTLLIEDYFNGKTKAKGIFQDRFGKVRRTFVVDITGTWDKQTQTLILDEDFVYNDGETERRIWTIKKTDEDIYQGLADGVVGTAYGEAEGNAFNFIYTFDLPYNGDKLRVKFNDWMYLLDNKTLFNKAVISKYGVRLGDVYITFEKL